MARKTKSPDILERLKHARWVLRVQIQFDAKGIGPCVATLDSPHGTKDSLRTAYKQAAQMVDGGEAVYAAAHDYWAKTYGSDRPLVLKEKGNSAWAI